MSSGSACWILWLTPMDWLALSIGRSGSQPLEYSLKSQEYDPLKLSEGKEKMRLVVDGSDDFIKDYHPQIFWIPNKFDLAKAGSFF